MARAWPRRAYNSRPTPPPFQRHATPFCADEDRPEFARIAGNVMDPAELVRGIVDPHPRSALIIRSRQPLDVPVVRAEPLFLLLTKASPSASAPHPVPL